MAVTSCGSPIMRPTITIRHGCPTARAWCSRSDRDRGPGRNDLYRLWFDDGARRSADDVLRRLRDHADACRRTAVGWPSSRQTFPYEDGWAYQVHVLELATKADVAVRSHRAADAGRTGRPTANRSRTSVPARAVEASRWCRRSAPSPQPMPARAARWHYYPDWSPDSRLLALSVESRTPRRRELGSRHRSIRRARCRSSG